MPIAKKLKKEAIVHGQLSENLKRKQLLMDNYRKILKGGNCSRTIAGNFKKEAIIKCQLLKN